MFFQGGMTMGYLIPPSRSEHLQQSSVALPEERSRRQITTKETPAHRESIAERSLLWAWRILS